MNWYYAQDGKQIGPVEESQFHSLVKAGKIKPDTLVWRDGMSSWAPYAEVAASFTERVESAPPSSRMSIPRASIAPQAETVQPEEAAESPGGVVCAECGGTFQPEQVIRLEGRFVCGNCKPLAVQKLREGVLAPIQLEYAGFWIRVAAKILDQILLQIVFQLIALAISGALQDATPLNAFAVNYFIGFVIGSAYSIFFNGRYGATPGKMALKLRIVRADGSPIGFPLATGRYFAEVLNTFTLGIGYIMVAFDEEKRGLHDRICDTRVIRS